MKTRFRGAGTAAMAFMMFLPGAACGQPAGFNRTIVASGLTSPTALDIAPDGRVFFVTQAGLIRVIQNDQLVSTPFADLRAATDGSGERGLLGIALDPNFATNRHVYIYYCALAGGSHNRLSRLTASASSPNQMQPGSELPLLDMPTLASLENPIYHMGGSVKFALDGTILLSVGDHLNAGFCQDLSSPIGKVLRIDRATGNPMPSNPFYNAGDGINFTDYVYCWGLRNAFSTAVQPGTGRLFLNDVGVETWEEINDGVAGGNYGWPITEGDFNQGAHPNFRRPFHTYQHVLGGPCAITGGTFYNPPFVQFPSSYTNKYFYSEFCTGVIYTLDLTTRAVATFIPDANFPITMAVSNDGALYYISRGDGAGGAPGTNLGTVVKIDYVSNAAPRILQHPQDVLVAAGQPATFSVQAGGSGTLTYQWQRNGVTISGANGTSYTIASATMGDNGATFRVRVTNTFGTVLSDAAILTVTNNQPPVVTIVQPAAGATYRGGDTIDYEFSAIDPETGLLPAQNVTWWVTFHHDDHVHPFIPESSGSLQGSFTLPVQGETATDVFYRIHVSAVDPIGLGGGATRDILPITANLTITTNVPGIVFTLDGAPRTTPVTVEGVAGMVRQVGMPGVQVVDGQTYRFHSWSDGGARTHDVVFPSSNATLSAVFDPVNGTFLSDLPFSTTPINGFGPVERDRSNGENSAGDGNVLTIGGVTFDKGLGVHADSDVTFNLDGRYAFFSASIGVDDEVGEGGSVTFEVWGDGVRLYNSGGVNGGNAPRPVSVPIDGINQIRLVVTNGGNSNEADHADWADALVLGMDPTPGPVAHYRMDEGTGPVVMDMTTGAWHGARNAGVAWAHGLIGLGALRFDGNAGEVTVADAPQLNPTQAVSLAAWVNATSWAGGNRRIMQKGGQIFLADVNDLLTWSITGVGTVTAPLPGTGAWHHVAGTYDRAALRLYVDGVQVGLSAATAAIPASPGALVIGSRPGAAASERFNGLIDDVQVYGRALTGEEVRNLAAVVLINFQPAAATPVTGYLIDSGATFGDQNGLAYGWSAPHSSVCLERNINPDQRLDTHVQVHDGERWEIDLDEGEYAVTVSIGDAGQGSTHLLTAEGTAIFDALPTNTNQFFERTRLVRVDDGRLTLGVGSAADGATRLNYLNITPMPRTPCRPDVNHDGVVNTQDFFDYLGAFIVGGPPADFNANGVVDSQDFFEFLAAFFEGCG